MTAADLMTEFLKLGLEEQEQFLNSLSLHLDLNLPDSKRVLILREDYARLPYREFPELYNIAKTVCLQNGMPWTDPRTGESFEP